jgi:hypothetical protein
MPASDYTLRIISKMIDVKDKMSGYYKKDGMYVQTDEELPLVAQR